VGYRIVENLVVDEFPLKKDGFRYTDESYMKCIRGESKWHEPDAIDYPALISEFRLAERVEKGEIDEVWLQAMPYSGCWESTMVGDGAYECNSDPAAGVACSRIFV